MHTHKEDDLDDMNERELALEYVRTAQLFLASCEENGARPSRGAFRAVCLAKLSAQLGAK